MHLVPRRPELASRRTASFTRLALSKSRAAWPTLSAEPRTLVAPPFRPVLAKGGTLDYSFHDPIHHHNSRRGGCPHPPGGANAPRRRWGPVLSRPDPLRR